MTSRPEQAGFVLYIRSSRLCTSSDEIHYHLAILPTAPGVESLTSKACRYCVLLLPEEAQRQRSHPALAPTLRPILQRSLPLCSPARHARRRGKDALKAYYEELTLNASRFFARDGGPKAKTVVKDMLGVILARMDATDATWSELAFQLATNFLPRHLAHLWFQPMFRIWRTINSGSATRRWYRVLGEVAQEYSQDSIETPLKAREGERTISFFTEHPFSVMRSASRIARVILLRLSQHHHL
ncbi:hypothetical protein V8E36_003039 [Tilletia maclaganii]